MLAWLIVVALITVSGAVALACVTLLVRALKSGVSISNWQQADRRRQPIRYWFDITVGLVVCFLSIRWFLSMCSLVRPLLNDPA